MSGTRAGNATKKGPREGVEKKRWKVIGATAVNGGRGGGEAAPQVGEGGYGRVVSDSGEKRIGGERMRGGETNVRGQQVTRFAASTCCHLPPRNAAPRPPQFLRFVQWVWKGMNV